jgi:hypothetical protein
MAVCLLSVIKTKKLYFNLPSDSRKVLDGRAGKSATKGTKRFRNKIDLIEPVRKNAIKGSG